MPATRFFMLLNHVEMLQMDRAIMDFRVQCVANSADADAGKEFQLDYKSMRQKVIKQRELINPAGMNALKQLG